MVKPGGRGGTRSRPQLVVFDLDGTLLRPHTACEVLAQRLGYAKRMAEIERITDRDATIAARVEMAGWYADSTTAKLHSYCASATCAPGVDAGIARLQAAGIHVALASITWDFAVAVFAQRWGIADYLATGLKQPDAGAISPVGSGVPGARNRPIDAEIRHVWPEDKSVWVAALAQQLGIAQSDVAAVGDSAGDFPMLTWVGMPIFVGQMSPLPPDAGRWWHRPDADIGLLCEEMIEGR